MSDHASVRVEITVAWWLQPYLNTLVFFCLMTGLRPDFDKIERTALRALRLRVVK